MICKLQLQFRREGLFRILYFTDMCQVLNQVQEMGYLEQLKH